jgi:hypothetical protein
VTSLAGALAAPHGAVAQQPGKVVSIGILAMEAWPPIASFQDALRTLGYVEGQNVRFEHRYAEGRNGGSDAAGGDQTGRVSSWPPPNQSMNFVGST